MAMVLIKLLIHSFVFCTCRLGDKFAFDKMFSDNAPVGVVTFGGEYYCITEAPFLHKIDPTTLETISKVTFSGSNEQE